MDHVFIEVQTVAKEITGIAVVRTNRKGQPLIAFSENVATKTNLGDPSLKEVIDGMKERVLDPFDASFIVVTQKVNIAREAMGRRLASKLWLDIRQLAWPMVHAQLIPTATLDSLAIHYLGHPLPDNRDGDCEVLVKVYWAMMNRYTAALKGEEVVREIGGKPLEAVKRLMGF